FDELDLLVVDRMSKEISGTGMDTTVIGRRRINGAPEWERPRIEVIAEHDREALDLSLYLLRRKKPEQVTMVRIRDTAHLEHLFVSEALLDRVKQNERLEILGDPEEIRFDPHENLIPDEVMKVPAMRDCSLPGEQPERKAA